MIDAAHRNRPYERDRHCAKLGPMSAPANRQGTTTRTRLLKTAERLFAAQGVDAVSVRAVNAAAGLGAASVNYHFGTKTDLLTAVLLDLGAPVRDRIRANVDALAARTTQPTPAELVHAVTDPYRELLHNHRTRGMRWIKIVSQLSVQAHPALEASEEDLRGYLLAQVGRTFPTTDPARLEHRWAVALTTFLQALAHADGPATAKPLTVAELTDLLDDQVTFLRGGLTALLGN
ncbi:helix-turn-helix domain-containing protein [Nocardia sp. NPDC005978]|uniref:TetR/AcrR family transcriptional regulator n=1 Tax=Nocardia sp. NPDC005978 TaxID=3156725 RepID=UPI0033BE3B9C